MRKWTIPLLGALVLVMGASGGCERTVTGRASLAADASPVTDTLRVTHVVDGDTVDLSDGRRVRVLGIDAPEIDECGYREATEFARTQLLGKQVTVTPDPTQRETDDYGRVLAYVAASEDYSIAAARAGWARRFAATPPVQKDAEIRAAEAAAQADKIGIWGPVCGRKAKPGAASTASATVTPTPVRSAQATTTTPAPRTTPTSTAAPRSTTAKPRCHPSYTPCVPDVLPRDLDCDDVKKKVRVVGPDVYRLDGDGNGWGCERYG